MNSGVEPEAAGVEEGGGAGKVLGFYFCNKMGLLIVIIYS